MDLVISFGLVILGGGFFKKGNDLIVGRVLIKCLFLPLRSDVFEVMEIMDGDIFVFTDSGREFK